MLPRLPSIIHPTHCWPVGSTLLVRTLFARIIINGCPLHEINAIIFLLAFLDKLSVRRSILRYKYIEYFIQFLIYTAFLSLTFYTVSSSNTVSIGFSIREAWPSTETADAPINHINVENGEAKNPNGTATQSNPV